MVHPSHPQDRPDPHYRLVIGTAAFVIIAAGSRKRPGVRRPAPPGRIGPVGVLLALRLTIALRRVLQDADLAVPGLGLAPGSGGSDQGRI